MKRFHVHMKVDDLAGSIGFYTKLFSAEPTRVEADYAKACCAPRMPGGKPVDVAIKSASSCF